MNIKATLRTKSAPQTGVSAETGNEWKRMDLIISWPDKHQDGSEFENYQHVSVFGEDLDRLEKMDLQTGDVFPCELQFNTRFSNKSQRVFNQVKLSV